VKYTSGIIIFKYQNNQLSIMFKLGVLISTVIGMILFILIIAKIGVLEIVDVFLQAKWFWLIPYLIISFLIICVLVFRWYIILLSHNHSISFRKLLLIHLSGFSVGFLSPFPLIGGEGIRALFLKKEGLRYKEAFSSIIIDRSITETMNIIFSIIGGTILIMHISLPKNIIYTIFFGVTIGFVILSAFYYRLMKGKGFFSSAFNLLKFINKGFVNRYRQDIIETEQRITKFFRHNKKIFVVTLILSLISWILMFAEYKFLLLTLGYNADFAILFLVIATVALIYMMPIPAALGVLEGGQASLFKFTNMGVSDGIALSILIRSRDLISTFIGLIYMFYYGISFNRRKQ